MISFQATINLTVACDAPASSKPNPNDPQAGEATVDAGMLVWCHTMQHVLNESVRLV